MKKKLEKIDFWFIDDREFYDFEIGEEITVIAPCGGQHLFVESGSSTHFTRLECGNFPKAIKDLGEEYKMILKGIENKITANVVFKKAPKTRCIFY